MQSLALSDLIEFEAGKRIRKRLIMADQIESELVYYAPGQATVEHHHVGQDEIFFIVEGSGAITVDGETTRVCAGSMVFAPAESKHSVQCDPDANMVMMFFKAPGRGARKAKKA
ncbi:MAG: cupin domain-containing protein [Alphaproteobacteria bacterium]